MPDVRLITTPYELREGELGRTRDGRVYVGLTNRQYIELSATVRNRTTVQPTTISTTTVVNNTLDLAGLGGVLKAVSGNLQGSATTTDLPEGSRLYFTDARALDAVIGIGDSDPATVTEGKLFINTADPSHRLLKVGIGASWVTLLDIDGKYLVVR